MREYHRKPIHNGKSYHAKHGMMMTNFHADFSTVDSPHSMDTALDSMPELCTVDPERKTLLVLCPCYASRAGQGMIHGVCS